MATAYERVRHPGPSALVNSEANARRIALVESCFGSAGQPLAVPGRVLVGEGELSELTIWIMEGTLLKYCIGVLTKACRKKLKARQFFLFNDLLVYGNIIINKKKYNKQHIIPLEDVKLQSLEDEGQFRNGWLIRTRGKSFAVYAATATEKQEWMAHIEKCVSDLLSKSGKKAALEHAAVWVPDAEATTCMVCHKTQFTLVNRRHHCRKCGAVVCGGCSTKKFLLPSQSSKPLRVCDNCFAQLNGRNDAQPPTTSQGKSTRNTYLVGINDRALTVGFQSEKSSEIARSQREFVVESASSAAASQNLWLGG